MPRMAKTATVGILRVLLTANSAEFEAAMKKAADSAKTVSKDLQAVGRQATQIGLSLTKTLTVPILAAGTALAVVGRQFDEASDQIRAATGATGKALDDLNASFKRVFSQVPASAEDVATAIGDLHTRTGQTGKALEDLAVQMLNLARVNKAEIGPLIRETTRLFGDWSIATDDQSESLDFLFKTSQATGIQVTQLAGTLVQFGAPLRALGFSFEQATALIGKFEKEGVNLETVLAGLRMGLKNFAKSGEEPAAALIRLVAEIKNAGSEAEANTKAFQVFGQRAGIDMARAIREGRFDLDELIQTLQNSRETINQAAADTKSLSEKFVELRNKVMVAVEPLGTALVNAFEALFDLVTPLVNALGLMAKAFTSLPTPVQAVAAGLVLVAAAAGPLLIVFGQLAFSASALAGAFAAQGLATRALTGHLGFLSTAVSGLAKVYALLWVPLNRVTLAAAAAAVKKGLLTGATTTLTFATNGLTVALRAAGAAMLAMPVATIVGALGAIGAAVLLLRQRYQDLADEAAKSARAQVAARGQAGESAVVAQIAAKERELAEAIRDGNRALAARLQAEVSALKSDQTRLAMLDVINKAVEQGIQKTQAYADKTISYAEAVAFNAQKERERVEAAKAGAKAIADGAAATTGAAAATDTYSAKLKAAQAELAKFGKDSPEKLKDLKTAIDSNAFSLDELQKKSGLSELAFKLLTQQLKETEKGQSRAAKEAEKHAKELEKQRDALMKLGIVTETSVNEALAELADLEKNATEGGAKHNVVLATMVPLYQALRDKAVASGVGVDAVTAALDRATEAAAALTAEFTALLPVLEVQPLTELPGKLVKVADIGELNAMRLGAAYERFGLRTRAEMRRTAEDSIAAFDLILNSGTATPQQIQDAFDQMQRDVNAANGKIPTFWEREVIPKVMHSVDEMMRGVSDGLASMLLGMQSFANGWKGIWEGIKRSTLNLVSSLIDDLLAMLTRRLLGGLLGQSGGLSSGFGGLLRNAAGLAPIGGGAAGGLPGTAFAMTPGGTAAAAGGAGLAGIAGGLGAGAAGFGLGFLGQQLFGGAGAGAAAFGGLGGAATGALIGSIVPGIGTLIGGVIGGLSGLIGGLFGGGKNRREVKQFAESMGGFDALRKRLLVLGDEGERLWKKLTQGGKDSAEAIGEIQEALARADAETADFNQSLTGLLQDVAALGGALPESLQGYLQQLQDAGRLTQDNIDLLAALAGGGEVSWQKMEELANKYGIAVSGLGKQFQEQRLHEGWQEIIDDLDTLERGGADMTAVLKGMADEISDLVNESRQFGTTIPENMRPWIERLIDLGLLLDENGDKITDISKLTFGETLQTSLQNLIATIENLIRTLGGIPTEINIDANVTYEEHNRPRPLTDEERRRERNPAEEGDEPGRFGPLSGGGFVRPVYASLGQLVPRPQYAQAGKAIARLFPPKGTDTVPAMLTPGELVLNEGQQANIGQSLDAAMRFVEQVKAETMAGLSGQSHTASFGVIRSETILEVDKRELGRAVADVLPGELRRLGVKVRS
jgi:TP901 family phage tail tape measure protein